ncbi:hypothetical protein GCM10009638_25390 [Luteococcus sanguinis]
MPPGTLADMITNMLSVLLVTLAVAIVIAMAASSYVAENS